MGVWEALLLRASHTPVAGEGAVVEERVLGKAGMASGLACRLGFAGVVLAGGSALFRYRYAGLWRRSVGVWRPWPNVRLATRFAWAWAGTKVS